MSKIKIPILPGDRFKSAKGYQYICTGLTTGFIHTEVEKFPAHECERTTEIFTVLDFHKAIRRVCEWLGETYSTVKVATNHDGKVTYEGYIYNYGVTKECSTPEDVICYYLGAEAFNQDIALGVTPVVHSNIKLITPLLTEEQLNEPEQYTESFEGTNVLITEAELDEAAKAFDEATFLTQEQIDHIKAKQQERTTKNYPTHD